MVSQEANTLPEIAQKASAGYETKLQSGQYNVPDRVELRIMSEEDNVLFSADASG